MGGASLACGSADAATVGMALGSVVTGAVAVAVANGSALLSGIAALLPEEQLELSVATTKAAANTKANWVWGERDQRAAAFGDQFRLGT